MNHLLKLFNHILQLQIPKIYYSKIILENNF